MKPKFFKKLRILMVLLPLLTGGSFAKADALFCGDGFLSSEEECDDGNFINRDGCSSYCKLEDMKAPTVTGVSIPNGQEKVSTLTRELTVHFSEAMDPASLNLTNINFKQYNKPLKIELELNDNKIDLTIHLKEELFGDLEYSLIMDSYTDTSGNMSSEHFVSTFRTGEYIDVTPPTTVARPEGGAYNVGQSVSLSAYIGMITVSDDFLDLGTKIYYTLDGSTPTSKSTLYTLPVSIKKDATLKYFGVDKKGNRGSVITQHYSFSCVEKPHAKKVTSYPECKVQECDYGFLLKSNVCVINLNGNDPNDYKANAATAPLFGSDTPITISTKPAFFITPEHRGIIPRPVRFVDLRGGTIIELERNTMITHPDGTPFTGYIKPPNPLYSKSFPLNFGYSFKTIFHLEPAEGGQLRFSPMIKITVPFTDRYDKGDSIHVFTYDPLTEEYFSYPQELVSVNEDGTAVSIASESTGTFFVAQPGQNYNAIVFKDTINHWAKNYIEQLYRWGFVKGRDKGVFAPDDILTRAEFTKIALNAIGETVDLEAEVEEAPFTDVPLYAWYTPYIKRAKDLKLISGYPDGNFLPDFPINRVEAVKILMAAIQFDLTSVGQRNDEFQDLLTWEWYFPSSNFAIQHKLIDGLRLKNGAIQYKTFGAAEPIKRGEMAKLTVKAVELRNSLKKKEAK